MKSISCILFDWSNFIKAAPLIKHLNNSDKNGLNLYFKVYKHYGASK